MSIAIVYERAGTDEMGIQFAAQKAGINLTFIPSSKIYFLLENDGWQIKSKGKDYFEKTKNVSVVLNRAQSKNRRLYIGAIFEALGKNVINPSQIEYICFSKLRTLLRFWKEKVKIPTTIYIPCNPKERTVDGREISNENEIAELIQQGFDDKPVVLKPDAGSHGKNIRLARKKQELLEFLSETQPSVINPIGVLAQEFVQKWFFDLRIIVLKEKGKNPYCHPRAMARTGLKDFRTNAYLGNMVFGVNLTQKIIESSIKCAESIGKGCEAWVLALDAMINFGREITMNQHLISQFEKLTPLFNEIQKIKKLQVSKENFAYWNGRLEKAFNNYENSEAYRIIRGEIEKTIKNMENQIVFHEANSCPDFWEQTRLAAGIDLAQQLLTCAESLLR
ncbi:MAG: ATP-grasp domain-containing protein [Candidatus Bathyarchaeia archaeon]